MDKNTLELLVGNRDAVTTNRGFYYQYLVLVKQWLQNFIAGNDVELYTEVDEDIKQVGDELIFTQVKCYTQNFSLNSKEVKQSVFNFFIHFLFNKDAVTNMSFVFHTNTSIKNNEKLLLKWINAQPNITSNIEIFNDCVGRVSNILTNEIKRNRNARLSTGRLSQEKKEKINTAFAQLNEKLNGIIIADFTSKLVWEFSGEMPEQRIYTIFREIQELLSHNKFEGRPSQMLMNTFLSEIYYRSQNCDRKNRLLTNTTMQKILQKTDEELNDFADKKLLILFDSSLNAVHIAISKLQGEQKRQSLEIAALKKRSFSISGIPKLITSIPFVDSNNVLGREQAIAEIHEHLMERKNLTITGIRGLGRMTVAQVYVEKYNDQYDHIIWINAEDGFEQNIMLNEALLFNLNLDFKDCKTSKQQLIKLQNVLDEVPGNNLFVICNYFEGFKEIEQFISLKRWSVIFTTRIEINNVFSYRVMPLNYEKACQLYHRYDAIAEDDLLKSFFEAVDYNTLVIELTAKTIRNSLDLTLSKFMELFLNQKLDDSELDIELNNNGNSKKIFSTLQNVFGLAGLSADENAILDLLALLPSETRISDLIAMCGEQFQKGNKLYFVNIFNQLHNKGWVERDGDTVKIHKMVQQIIIYKERRKITPFVAYGIFISWLLTRFQEGFSNNPNTSIRYLTYGESILNTIKEKYRDGIHQPLLALENEVLNVYNLTVLKTNTLQKWESLASRAKVLLAPDDILLGVIYNNYAMALTPDKKYEEVEKLLNSAVDIFRQHEGKAPHQLLNGLNNLSILCLEKRDFAGFNNIFIECEALRKKYNMLFDKTIAAQTNALGVANQNADNYNESIRLFKLAIKLHSYIDKKSANDLDLIIYINNLAFSYFISNKNEEAIKYQEKALALCEQYDFQDGKTKSLTIQTLISMYVANGNYEAATNLKNRISNIAKH